MSRGELQHGLPQPIQGHGANRLETRHAPTWRSASTPTVARRPVAGKRRANVGQPPGPRAMDETQATTLAPWDRRGRAVIDADREAR